MIASPRDLQAVVKVWKVRAHVRWVTYMGANNKGMSARKLWLKKLMLLLYASVRYRRVTPGEDLSSLGSPAKASCL